MTVSGDFLYPQSGGSVSVKAFAVSEDGSLAPIGSWTIRMAAARRASPPRNRPKGRRVAALLPHQRVF
jgi:hypothetical protein